jgi:hypothetical protein
MATAEEVNAKNTEFQAAVADLEAANADYETTKAPYLVAKQSLVNAIDRVDAIDAELEALTAAYEPQAKPENA